MPPILFRIPPGEMCHDAAIRDVQIANGSDGLAVAALQVTSALTAAAFRQARINEEPIHEVLERLDDEQTRLLLAGIRANVDHGVPLEDALAAVKTLMDERRGVAT